MIDFSGNIEFLLAFVSAILGLSVPVMLQVIERVDQRYESTRLAERLKREPIVKSCIYCLIASLICCLYAVFVHIPSPCDCWLLNNSADLIALISWVALIVCFLFSCKVILAYYNPEKLQDIILASYGKAKTEMVKEQEFLDWVDITKALLQSSDREPAFKVYDTLGRAIYKAFEKAGDEGVSFPSYLVRGITSINENLCLMQRRPYSINNGNQILKNLIGVPAKLSDDGYRLLWSNLQLQLFYNQEDWVHEYWSAAVQNYDLELQELYADVPVPFDNENLITVNQVVKRKEQRKRFLEFHLTLCASILRDLRYDLLEKIMEHYRSMTPEYEYPLVPSSVSEVLDAFEMIEESPRLDFGVENYYPLRGMKGIADGIVTGSIKRYLTYLYVRVFSNIGRMKRTYANYPDSLGGLKRMDEHLDYLQRMLPSILGNESLMKTLSFSDFEDAQRQMSNVLSSIRVEISAKEKEQKKNKPNAQDIVEENLRKVVELVQQGMVDYSPFIKDQQDEIVSKPYYLRGVNSFLYPNEAFQHDAGISYVNMAESVSEASISNIQHGFASVFYQMKQKRLKINSEKVFKAIDNLALDGKYIIIAFDIYWDYYLSKRVRGLSKNGNLYCYKGVPIIHLHGGPTDLVSQKMFILQKKVIPILSFVSPVKEHIDKYGLKELDEKFKVYGSIVRLNDYPELLSNVNNMSEESAREHSLFNVFINAKLAVNTSSPVVSIKIMYDLRDNGTADNVDDVIPFEAMFGLKKDKETPCLETKEKDDEDGQDLRQDGNRAENEAYRPGIQEQQLGV